MDPRLQFTPAPRGGAPQPEVPSSTPGPAGRADREGDREKSLWPLPISWPAWSPSLVSQDAAEDGDRQQCPAQMVSRCSALHLLACLSPPKTTSITSEPHALLCLCLGLSKTAGRRILSTEPLRLLHLYPSSPACTPRGTHSQQCVKTSMHTSPGLPAQSAFVKSCFSGSGLWPG